MLKFKNVLLIAMMLSVTNLLAQIYHEEDKEDLRAFMRQGNNLGRVWLFAEDSLLWYENEEWVEKVIGITWIETEGFILRIEKINWKYLGLEGKLNFRSPVLRGLNCSLNDLTELDVSNSVNLTHLDCGGNNLTSIDVSNNVNLTHLNCGSNNLTELDVSNNIYLEILLCFYNNLTELDVSSNIHLNELCCNDNRLTKLVINKNEKWSILCCYNNSLKLSTIPICSGHNLYAPQDTIYGGIKEYNDTVNLRDEYEIGLGLNYTTNFEWFDITDGEEKDIKQPINVGGIFYFKKEHADKKLRCKMENIYIKQRNFYINPCIVYETTIVLGIKEHNEEKHIYEIAKNTYLLNDEMKNVVLYDMLGQRVLECKNTRLDLNFLPIGVYVLQYRK